MKKSKKDMNTFEQNMLPVQKVVYTGEFTKDMLPVERVVYTGEFTTRVEKSRGVR